MSPKQILPPSKRLPAPLWGDNERKRYMLRALLSSQLSNRIALSRLRAKDTNPVCESLAFESKSSRVPVVSLCLRINR